MRIRVVSSVACSYDYRLQEPAVLLPFVTAYRRLVTDVLKRVDDYLQKADDAGERESRELGEQTESGFWFLVLVFLFCLALVPKASGFRGRIQNLIFFWVSVPSYSPELLSVM